MSPYTPISDACIYGWEPYRETDTIWEKDQARRDGPPYRRKSCCEKLAKGGGVGKLFDRVEAMEKYDERKNCGETRLAMRVDGLIGWGTNQGVETMLSPRIIEDLKAAEHYFAAGAVAKALGGSRFYGCHVGMKSTRDRAIAEFYRGFDAA